MGIVGRIVKGINDLFLKKKQETVERDALATDTKEVVPEKENLSRVPEMEPKEEFSKKEKPAEKNEEKKERIATGKKRRAGKKKKKRNDVSRQLEKEMNAIIGRRKMEAGEKIRQIKKEADGRLTEEIKQYRSEIVKLGKKIDVLSMEVEKQKLEPRRALGGVQVMYREIESQKKNIESEIKKNTELMKYLEHEFLTRKISEQMFTQKMFEYREKLHILNLEKKELENQKDELRETKEHIPAAPKISLDELSTSNIEELLKKQQETLEKLAQKDQLKSEPIQTAMRITTPMKKIYIEEGKETEVKKYAISTDYDRILVLVEEKGSAKFSEIAKETGMDRERVEECCELLEEESQLAVVYPAIGEPRAQSLDFKERQEMEKLKKKKDAKEKVKKK